MGSSNAASGVIARLAFAVAVAGLVAALPRPLLAEGACHSNALDLRTRLGSVHFSVEIADTGAERAKGLMFRKEMATSAGMLFVYDTPRPVSFWMKDTLIPLDMLFIDRTGTVTRVHENAAPGDLRPVDGGNRVQFVLEINGGMAARLGIGPGAVIRHPAIAPDNAAWPC